MPPEAPDAARAPEAGLVRVEAVNYDGSPHWTHPARLLAADASVVLTATTAGLTVVRGNGGVYTSPYDTRGHYWPDRWFNVIRLEEPGRGLFGFYCNVATPVQFDGASVRYVDLQLDVRVRVEAAAWTWTLVDEDEFAAARERYAYPRDVVERARGAVDELTALIEARLFPFDR